MVELAPDIAKALETAGKYSSFKALSYSHQREYVQWIEAAKQPQTRESRIQKTVEKIA
ncbi:MAG TPA: YdeI/OmpD-associated family protein [Candidatus Saccharimonadales bacterium]|nr:YdeI/OmpD-associated family protein [Candidatus Saccharimonadales bacterium]